MKKNYFLYLAILIPIIMIISVVISVQFSLFNMHPKFNFVYATIDTSNTYYCEQKLLLNLFPAEYSKTILPSRLYGQPTDCKNIKYYIYNFKNNTSSYTELAQVTQLKLNRATSPDGYKLTQYCRASFPMGWIDDIGSPNAGGLCIIKNNTEQKIKVEKPFNFGTYVFLGWIIQTSAEGIKK